MSSKDIPPGKFWHQKITSSLSASTVGIVIVTPENREASWLNYEAGALAQSILAYDGSVIPLLVNMAITDLQGPMANLQVKVFGRESVLEILKAINGHTRFPVTETLLEDEFEEKWARLETQVHEAIVKSGSVEPQGRGTEDMLIEIVEGVREIKRLSNNQWAGRISQESLKQRERELSVQVISIFAQHGLSIAQPDITTTLDGIVHVYVVMEQQSDQGPLNAAMNEISQSGPFQISVRQVQLDENQRRRQQQNIPAYVRTQPLFNPPPMPGQLDFESDSEPDDDEARRQEEENDELRRQMGV